MLAILAQLYFPSRSDQSSETYASPPLPTWAVVTQFDRASIPNHLDLERALKIDEAVRGSTRGLVLAEVQIAEIANMLKW